MADVWLAVGHLLVVDGQGPIAGASGTLHLSSDTGGENPLPLTDPNGTTIPLAVSDDDGVLQPCRALVPEGTGVLVWRSGSRQSHVPVWQGMVDATASSAADAATARQAAEMAAAAAITAAGQASGITGAPTVWPTSFPPSGHAHPSTDLRRQDGTSPLSATVRSLLDATDPAGARAAIGASNLVLGASGSTAMPGDAAYLKGETYSRAEVDALVVGGGGGGGLTALAKVAGAWVERPVRLLLGAPPAPTTAEVPEIAGTIDLLVLTPELT